MRNSKYCLFLFIVCLILTGCGNINFNSKELTNEEKLCQNISPSIEKYQNNQITYDEFLNLIEGDYNTYCADNDNNICLFINNMYSSNELSLELEDCNKYNENDSFGKSMKDLCEAANNTKKEMAKQKLDAQKASVNNVRVSCESISNN